MTYSIEGLLFKAAAGVVNTAARAANSLLEVMYPPRYDAAHIWDELDVPAGSVASGGPAPTDPPSGGAADPAAEKVNPPDLSAAGSPLTWSGWAEPAVLDVLGEHIPHIDGDGEFWCSCTNNSYVYGEHTDWCEHVAPLIAERIGCDPARAALALTSLQTQ